MDSAGDVLAMAMAALVGVVTVLATADGVVMDTVMVATGPEVITIMAIGDGVQVQHMARAIES